jgi:hypothetical protein
MIDRELVYSALWDRVSGAASFTTKSRRLRHWDNISPAEQPALFMSVTRMVGETKNAQVNLRVEWILHAEFYIFVHSPDPYAAPSIILNPLIDAIERALDPDPVTGVNDLGLPGLVYWARLHGEIATAEGVLGDQEMAIIPVEVRCV